MDVKLVNLLKQTLEHDVKLGKAASDNDKALLVSAKCFQLAKDDYQAKVKTTKKNTLDCGPPREIDIKQRYCLRSNREISLAPSDDPSLQQPCSSAQPDPGQDEPSVEDSIPEMRFATSSNHHFKVAYGDSSDDVTIKQERKTKLKMDALETNTPFFRGFGFIATDKLVFSELNEATDSDALADLSIQEVASGVFRFVKRKPGEEPRRVSDVIFAHGAGLSFDALRALHLLPDEHEAAVDRLHKLLDNVTMDSRGLRSSIAAGSRRNLLLSNKHERRMIKSVKKLLKHEARMIGSDAGSIRDSPEDEDAWLYFKGLEKAGYTTYYPLPPNDASEVGAKNRACGSARHGGIIDFPNSDQIIDIDSSGSGDDDVVVLSESHHDVEDSMDEGPSCSAKSTSRFEESSLVTRQASKHKRGSKRKFAPSAAAKSRNSSRPKRACCMRIREGYYREPDSQAGEDFPDSPAAEDNFVRSTESHAKRLRKICEAMRLPFVPNFGNVYLPCDHGGACGFEVKGCTCYDHRVRCEKYCSCAPDCPNRFPGCDCTGGKCQTDECACCASNRECEHSKCACFCGPTDFDKKSTLGVVCRNVQVRYGQTKACFVKPSEIEGFGLFAAEALECGDFIGCYSGQVIDEEEAQRRMKPNGRNYFFDYVGDMVVDAALMGNQTRFANHSSASSNLEAGIVTVDGVAHVAIYAKRPVAEGEELLLDYGENYGLFDDKSSQNKDEAGLSETRTLRHHTKSPRQRYSRK